MEVCLDWEIIKRIGVKPVIVKGEVEWLTREGACFRLEELGCNQLEKLHKQVKNSFIRSMVEEEMHRKGCPVIR